MRKATFLWLFVLLNRPHMFPQTILTQPTKTDSAQLAVSLSPQISRYRRCHGKTDNRRARKMGMLWAQASERKAAFHSGGIAGMTLPDTPYAQPEQRKGKQADRKPAMNLQRARRNATTMQPFPHPTGKAAHTAVERFEHNRLSVTTTSRTFAHRRLPFRANGI